MIQQSTPKIRFEENILKYVYMDVHINMIHNGKIWKPKISTNE